MLALIKKVFSFKKKTVWYYFEEDLARVPDGSVIISNYGFLNSEETFEWKKLEDDLWRNEDGKEVKDVDIIMPFTVLSSR